MATGDKISELPAGTIAGGELVPMVQGGVTKKGTLGSMAAETATDYPTDAQLAATSAPSGASLVGVDNTGYEVLTGSDAQTIFDETDSALLKARSTGVLFGGALSDQGSGVIRIAAGEGGILDNTDPENPTYTAVTWAQQDVDLSMTDDVYYLYIDDTGTLQNTTTEPSHADYRTYIWLHRVSILSNVYSASTPIPMPVQQYGPGIWDLFRALGFIKRDLDLSAASTNLTIAVAAGEVYQAGANFYTSAISPHEVEYPLKSPATFRMVTQAGALGSDITSLPVGSYDNAGTITAIPGASTRATVFTVKMFAGSGGNIRIFYGQAFYNNVADAQAALTDGTLSFVSPAIYNEAVTLGWIIAEKGATNLADGTQTFITANKFGGVGGSLASSGAGALLAANNLSDLTDVTAAQQNLDLEPGVDVQAYDADLQALADNTDDGLWARTGAGTGAARTITAGTGISVSDGDGVSGDPTIAASSNYQAAALVADIDGGGAEIETGIQGWLQVPFACTITSNTLLADQSGSIVIDIWKDTYANYPPDNSDSITASAPPTISATNKSTDSTLTGWTTSVSAGDILYFNVDSVSTIEHVVLTLFVTKT